MRPIAAAWRAVGPEALTAWRCYAEEAGLQPYQAFTGLAAKCLQMRPDAPVPESPPTSPFAGDGIAVRIAVGPEGSDIGFFANAANSPGVVTELLLVRLASRNRRPQAKAYRTRAFVRFEGDVREASVAVEPGAWACAVRFVREATGQMGALVELGVVTVG